MAQDINLSRRDLAILALLEMTPVTVALLRKASVTFGEEPFRDERRVRERMQALTEAGYVQTWSAALTGGGLLHYYRLSTSGYRVLHAYDSHAPPRTLVSEIAPSRYHHTMVLAEVIVHAHVAAQAARVRIARFHGEGKLTLAVGEYCQQPDCHFQFQTGGRSFNVLFEIDNATEPLDSLREQSLRSKLLGYELYQDWVLNCWKHEGCQGARPRFRVVVLTTGAERARHILWLARRCARNPQRRLCYTATQDAFLAEPLALTTALLNDHDGRWRSLTNPHPTSRFLREPIRVTPPLAPRLPV